MKIIKVGFRFFIRGLLVFLPIVVWAATTNAQTPVRTPAFWELIGGYEGDTHGSGYAFFGPSYVHPLNPSLAWTARVFGNYLSYRFNDGGGETTVHSPGVDPSLGLRFGDKNFFGVSAGPEVKLQRKEFLRTDGSLIRDETKTRYGGNFGAEMYANPTSHNNVQGILNYNTTDRYTWGRLGFKERVSSSDSNTTFLGAEGIGQGNKDIKSVQAGGFIEIVHVPANVSLMFKVGYKRSTFQTGPDKTGPYFAVGYYQRLN
jgi:hypothetical protein